MFRFERAKHLYCVFITDQEYRNVYLLKHSATVQLLSKSGLKYGGQAKLLIKGYILWFAIELILTFPRAITTSPCGHWLEVESRHSRIHAGI